MTSSIYRNNLCAETVVSARTTRGFSGLPVASLGTHFSFGAR